MASVLQVATIKDQGGSANAIEIENSSANVTINQLTSNTKFPAGGTGNPISVAVIADEKGSTTSGGAFNSGAWQTRDLNTVISDTEGVNGTVTVSSNQFTLGAGTYLIEWSCPAYDTNRHQTKLYSITNSSDLATGASNYSPATYDGFNRSTGAFVHTISASHTYEIRHHCQTSKTNIGFGIDGQTGLNSVYTIVKISKLK